jgi:tetratricopeptide (TPR) repeat protein
MSPRKPIPSREIRRELKRAEKALSAGRREEAEKAYRSAISSAPEDERLLLLYAKALSDWGREEEALEQALLAAKKDPRNPYAHFVAGMIRFDRAEKDTARAEFEKCLELEPENLPARAFLSLLDPEPENKSRHARRPVEDSQAAASHITSALWDNDFLSRLLLVLEKRDSSVSGHRLVNGSAPAESAVWGTPRERRARAKELAHRGYDLLEEGLPESALEHLLLCIELDPALSEKVALSLGRAYCVLDNLSKAVEWLRKIPEGHSDRAEGDFWMGEVCRRRGDWDKALTHFAHALERLGDGETRARIHFLRALCLVKSIRPSEARLAFRQSLLSAPLHLLEEYIMIAKDAR